MSRFYIGTLKSKQCLLYTNIDASSISCITRDNKALLKCTGICLLSLANPRFDGVLKDHIQVFLHGAWSSFLGVGYSRTVDFSAALLSREERKPVSQD